MGETSTIEWTATIGPDGIMRPGATFSPWWGCVRVSSACAACYAADWAKRFGTEWGPDARRRFFPDKHWREPIKWNAKAAQEGVRRKVFCASMADVFERLPDGHPDTLQMDAERTRLWLLIEATPHLDWLLLTKRPENVLEMVPIHWRKAFPANVWMGVTAEDQKRADERIPLLSKIPAVVLFLSMEPLREAVDLRRVAMVDKSDGVSSGYDFLNGCRWWCSDQGEYGEDARPVDWVIVGGESGPKARPSHPDWVRSLRDQCVDAAVPFFFKQWGEYEYTMDAEDWSEGMLEFESHELRGMTSGVVLLDLDGKMHPAEASRKWLEHYHIHDEVEGAVAMHKVGKHVAGHELDGQEWKQFPGLGGAA